MLEVEGSETSPPARPPAKAAGGSPAGDLDAVSTKAEAGLGSEAGSIKEQGREAKSLQEAENLLTPASAEEGK